jgi:hypothetical protein
MIYPVETLPVQIVISAIFFCVLAVFNRDRCRLVLPLFFLGLVCFSLFGAGAASAAPSNYGWTYGENWADGTCGANHYMSSNPSQYGNRNPITVGNNNFQIRRVSDQSLVASYNGTSQGGPGCIDVCNHYYVEDVTGNATYGDFYASCNPPPFCGRAAQRLRSMIYFQPKYSGID